LQHGLSHTVEQVSNDVVDQPIPLGVIHDVADQSAGLAPVVIVGSFDFPPLVGRGLRSAVQLAVDHSIARHQFGRSLSKFQAVQMLVAEAAGEAALARTAVEHAVEVIETRGILSESAELAVADSRACIGLAARVVARNAHQVHGAIGSTLDHQLRHFSLRASAWRNEYGTQRYWKEVVGPGRWTVDGGIWDLISRA